MRLTLLRPNKREHRTRSDRARYLLEDLTTMPPCRCLMRRVRLRERRFPWRSMQASMVAGKRPSWVELRPPASSLVRASMSWQTTPGQCKWIKSRAGVRPIQCNSTDRLPSFVQAWAYWMAAVARTTSPMLEDRMMATRSGLEFDFEWFNFELKTLIVDKNPQFD